ncbi:MAG: ATP-binding protein [Paludibacteraceae bacterium]|nr:ATP-binding protein [Paludibacteraceae bacterium]
MRFSRTKYLQRLLVGRGNGMVKIVTGVRRCGKSFLLFNIFRSFLMEEGVPEDHIISLTMDERKMRPLRDPDRLLAYIDAHFAADNQTHYIILDEVQMVEDFVEVLLTLMRKPNTEVYVSGSNSKFLSSDVVTEFRGRGDEIRVYPLSLSEYMEGTGLDYTAAVKYYFIYGGLPQVALMEDVQKKEDFLRTMTEVTYLRDVVDRNHLRNEEGMRELLRILASSVASSTNPTKIADTFKSVAHLPITDTTVRQYIGYLQNAFLVEEALRYDIKGRRYIGAENKYYFVDPGIRNALLNFRQIDDGHLMENMIFNELRMRGYLVDVGRVETWQTVDGQRVRKKLEIDFVVNRGSRRYYIQSAFELPDSAKMEQEGRSLQLVDDSFRKIILVYEDILPRRDEKGITTMGLKQFLTDVEALDKA